MLCDSVMEVAAATESLLAVRFTVKTAAVQNKYSR